MRKGQIWKDKSGGLWEIVVLDDQGEFPIGAKSLSQDRLGLHLFTKDGRYQAGADSLFDLKEHVTTHTPETRMERDDMFQAACHAMQAMIGKAETPRFVAEKSVDYAIALVEQFHARVRK